jgi:Cu+-exporting ATPase
MTQIVKEIKGLQHIDVPVEGMTCASCVVRVEKSISKIEGVSNVSVNFATEKASFDIDTSVADYHQITEAVNNAGYKIHFSSLNNEKTNVEAEMKLEEKDSEYEKGLKRDFFFAAILSVPILILNMGMIWEGFHLIIPLHTDVINKILLLLTTPVVFISGKRFYQIFWNNLKHFAADMNSLVAIGTGSAYLFSVAVTLFPEVFESAKIYNHVYFDTTSVIIALILMGRWLEIRAKSRTGSAIKKLIALKPQTVLVKRNGKEQEINIDKLIPSDLAIIKPGGKIPSDGTIKKGYSTIDESMITGESIPVEKSEGSKVIGGTINRSGTFEYEVTTLGDNSVLGQIIKLVETAQGSKAPIQKLADKVSAIFVPVIILIAIITFFAWLIFGNELGINSALVNFVSVLIIACPCALGLATPTAIIVGTGKGAQKGILIKNGEALEIAHKLDTIILDKTGTITTGKPVVSSIYVDGVTEKEFIKLTASLEQRSEHPLAQAIVSYAKSKNIELFEVDDFSSNTGLGLKGRINGTNLLIGNQALMEKNLVSTEKFQEKINEYSQSRKTIIFIAFNNELKGLIAVEDPVKEHASEAIRKLKELNLKTIMLTGDNKFTAETVAKFVGVDEFEAELLPENKIEVVKKYQNQNHVVAMVGDGINDAPALAQSNIGIAIGMGTDVAIETGDIILISGDLNGVVKAINLSRRTIRTIKQNLFWAFIYNVIGVPLAAFGLLNPIFAALAMSFSSVSVVSNSLRLKSMKL